MVKQKGEVVIKCSDCGKKIKGFSKHHAEKNLEIHKQTSKFHIQVVKAGNK